MLGISVYLSEIEEDYLKSASESGAEFVFTSLQIPEEKGIDILKKTNELLSLCQKYHLMLVPDISPVTFEKFNREEADFDYLKSIGLTALRLDYGFDDFSLLKRLQKQFTLFLNASIVDEDYLKQAEQAGVDLRAIHPAHNFYPKVNTGISGDYFNQLNGALRKRGLNILGFIPGDAKKRFPFYQGLPTIEGQRAKNSYVAAVELIAKFGVTDIAVGDSRVRAKTLRRIHQYMAEHTLEIPIILDNDNEAIQLEQPYQVRKDLSDDVYRLRTDRIPNISISKTSNRGVGTITQDNQLSGRYSGEIQICKKDLPFYEGANLIGYVHPEYLELLKYIDKDTILKFTNASD